MASQQTTMRTEIFQAGPRAQVAPPRWSLARTALAAGAVVAAVQIVLLMTVNNGVLHGTLFDPDCYMHLQRALRMMTEGGWRETMDLRINAPGGYAIHWTNLFDLLLVLGATPLCFFGMEPHAALYLWGSCISPLLLIAALSVLAWGVRPWVGGAFFLWLTVLVFTQPQFSGSFLAGRPDHHSLVMALLLAQLAWLYATLDGRAGLRWASAAGVLAGIQMCTSVEALLTILMVAAVLMIAWLLYGVRTLKPFAVYLCACVVTIFAWLVWEHRGISFQPGYDRVSIVHLTALGSGFLCFTALAAADGRGWLGRGTLLRLGSLVAAAGLSAVITAVFFPDFFLGPWPHLDPIVAAWHRTIVELQPLLPTDLHRAAQFLAQLTAPLLSIPLIVGQLRGKAGGGQPLMLVSLVGLVLFGAVALVQMRWSAEVQAVTLLPWALTTRQIMRSQMSLNWGRITLPLRSFALVGALLLQMVPAALAHRSASFVDFAPQAAGSGARCQWSKVIQAMAPLGPVGGIVLTQPWYGPEILWRTSFRVVGGPYEIAPALADTYDFLNGDEHTARGIARRRHAAFVLICAEDKASGFADALRRGEQPAWLRPVALSGDLSAFRLYRVVGL